MISTTLRIENLFNVLKKNFSFCISTQEGKVLHGNFSNAVDCGTLPAAILTAHDFFHPKAGDLVLLNDPFSGGTTLDSLTLITAIHIGSTQWLIGGRWELTKRISLTKSVDEEGLRIPPTPIGKDFTLNREILSMIEQHLLCGKAYATKVATASEQLWTLAKEFKSLYEFFELDNSSNRFAYKYFDESEQRIKELIQEIPQKEVRLNGRTSEQKERIDLCLKVERSQIVFDFLGSSEPQGHGGLTAFATMGLCLVSAVKFLRWKGGINEGLYRSIKVMTPSKCWLDVHYPSPVFWGFNCGSYFLNAQLVSAFSEWDPLKARPIPLFGPQLLRFEDSKGLVSGEVFPETPSSIEENEANNPFLISKIAIRKNSGGKGEVDGAHGLVKEWKILEPAKLSWSLTHTEQKPQGVLNGHNGSITELTIDGDILPKVGTAHLKPGQTLSLLSAAEGGLRKPPQKEEVVDS